MTSPSPQQVLDLPLPDNDAEAGTIRGYLAALLTLVWQDGEGFDGKRPFGNSGWQDDLYLPLVKAGMVPGAVDEYGCLDWADYDRADKLILAAIKTLGEP